MLLVEGYDTVTPEKKFVLDVLVFDAEKYPQASPTFNRNAAYTVDGVSVNIELHNEEGQIHTFSGTTKDGFLRYEILARETSQDGTLWMINNLYTVDVSVSLDGENTGKIHQFYGISNYDKGSATTTTTSTSWEEQVTKTVEINPATTNGPTLTGGDNFGSSIVDIGDLDGDGVNDLAVGAGKDDEGGSARGAVHIMFMNTDGSVDSTVEINDSTTNGPTLTNTDQFGFAVENIGDLNSDGVNDLAVGAYLDDEGGGARGAVHIMFMNTDGSVDSTVEINDSTTNGPELEDDDSFGRSVANIGDLDGDGVNDLAVGAHQDDDEGTDRGAVHIMFMNTDGSVDSTVEINDSTTNGPELEDDDSFGRSVANIGDLDGDGVNDLAVGADKDNAGGANRGTIHIIHMNTDGSVDSTVEINNETTNGPSMKDQDFFGFAVANIGDLDGNGINDLAVGAYGDDGGAGVGNNSGAVHLIFLE